jgi:hypothetical protein
MKDRRQGKARAANGNAGGAATHGAIQRYGQTCYRTGKRFDGTQDPAD